MSPQSETTIKSTLCCGWSVAIGQPDLMCLPSSPVKPKRPSFGHYVRDLLVLHSNLVLKFAFSASSQGSPLEIVLFRAFSQDSRPSIAILRLRLKAHFVSTKHLSISHFILQCLLRHCRPRICLGDCPQRTNFRVSTSLVVPIETAIYNKYQLHSYGDGGHGVL